MKKVEAIIRSSKFEAVKNDLSKIGINFFTFFEVKGYGRQLAEHVVYRGAEYDIGYIARLKIELIVEDQNVKRISDTIRHAAQTGEIGDGKIIISAIEEIVSIRTGSINESAL
ncbi:MAG: P-II family nitrogen regulator [Saprospiraceae bacterium]|jgi:nitrogen regulatory protein P-II 1|nr:P-II family nitrogen regulator [Saprospiraceae bacterium]MBL0025249.1 P-II family nitrogen regulator [Saprospiraceae bacterium]